MHREVSYGVCAVTIGELHVPQVEVSPYRLRLVVARHLHLLVVVQYSEEPFGIDEGVVQVVINTMQLTYRSAHVAEKQHVVHDLTYSHARIVDEHQVCGKYDYQHRAYLLDEGLQAFE